MGSITPHTALRIQQYICRMRTLERCWQATRQIVDMQMRRSWFCRLYLMSVFCPGSFVREKVGSRLVGLEIGLRVYGLRLLDGIGSSVRFCFSRMLSVLRQDSMSAC